MADAMGQHNQLRYRGYVYDPETELYFLNSRFYDPETGRFLNADVLVATGQGMLGNNMFAYCGNNPVVHYDPDGFCYVAFSSEFKPYLFPNYCCTCGGGGMPMTVYGRGISSAKRDLPPLIKGEDQFFLDKLIHAVFDSLCISVGVGQGLYGGFDVSEALGVEIGMYGNYGVLTYEDGQWTTGQEIHSAFTGTLGGVEFGFSETLTESSTGEVSTSSFTWINDEKDTITLWSFAAYLFVGVSVSVEFDSIGFVERMR